MSLEQLHLKGYNPKEKAEAIVNELKRMYDIHMDDAAALIDAIGEVWKSTAQEERNRTYAEDFFSAGTHREEIWHWFEGHYGVRVYDLLYGGEDKDE